MDILVDLIQPDYTILTPIGKKHLATLQDIQTLVEEIVKLIKATPPHGWSLLLRDHHIEKYCSHFSCHYFFWNEAYPELPHATLLPYPLYHLPNFFSRRDCLSRKHPTWPTAYFLNLFNIATKAAWLIGISSSQMISVLQSFQPEPSRTEIWTSSLGSIFINEPYCSDPQSVDRALHHFDYASAENRKIFVFAGMRGQNGSSQTDYRRIGKAIAKTELEQLLLVGKNLLKV